MHSQFEIAFQNSLSYSRYRNRVQRRKQPYSYTDYSMCTVYIYEQLHHNNNTARNNINMMMMTIIIIAFGLLGVPYVCMSAQ